jgi:hypothetical protein
MRHSLLVILAVALLASSPVAAQSTTADGIGALARGDTAGAFRILRPLADAPVQDPLAQFFLATIYNTGSGVQMETIRACGLYLKSAIDRNPLAKQAVALADAIHLNNPQMRALCVAGMAGVWREPPSARFQLGPDHWVTTDSSGFIVGYGGVQRTVPTDWGGPEWVFLPTRYTRLEVTRPIATTRHFIEFLFWIPDDVQSPAVWTLVWSVFEVVGSEAYPLPDTAGVASVTATRPPASYPVAAVGCLQVNADGDIERVVSGPNGHTSVVPYRGPR